MARVFLTGGSGFLGRHVATRLRERGHRVTSLQRRTGGELDAVAGDLTSPAPWASRLVGADVVIHLAAVTGRAPREEYGRVNVGGTRALVEASRHAGVPRLLFCSTIAAGFPDLSHYPYADSKFAAEAIVHRSGLRTVTIRPTIIAGPGSPVITKLASLATLPIIPAFDGGRARIQPILVDDLADLIVDVVDADRFDGEGLELGGRDVITIREALAHLHGQQRQTPARFLPVPLGVLLPPVRILESLFGPSLPLSVGQLATFRFDGVARPNSLWTARRDRLASLDQVLSQARRS